MNNAFDIEWEELEVRVKQSSNGLYKHKVRLFKPKDSKSPNSIIIGGGVVGESGWSAGDRVTMLQAKGVSRMYAIRRQNSGNGKGELTLKRYGKSTDTLTINSVGACLKLQYPLNGYIFDAEYDSDKDLIVLTPSRKEQDA